MGLRRVYSPQMSTMQDQYITILLYMMPTPIDLQSSLCLNPSDLNEEGEVDTGNTGKSKNSVSSGVDALDSETYPLASRHSE
jgi:hypothetical protein